MISQVFSIAVTAFGIGFAFAFVAMFLVVKFDLMPLAQHLKKYVPALLVALLEQQPPLQALAFACAAGAAAAMGAGAHSRRCRCAARWKRCCDGARHHDRVCRARAGA